eukprot:CAMPEP_0118696516 /NCGR_PEP_ID=MMETSP0800-20121206/13893_1 /TAXON_ID=210618 ORGANISM="Striatella unipunctata, Strain CCMP2910" /NCGR_SAMPLE_ID=MMETSP0800 /ASSEMBLY_ACC=CAM_ASM_000638 /LENGTH=92 /DNA_ID=CAMNT_0006595643 /DNA_START=336 /DNA_END=614 /DNA_ORIENTATION=+
MTGFRPAPLSMDVKNIYDPNGVAQDMESFEGLDLGYLIGVRRIKKAFRKAKRIVNQERKLATLTGEERELYVKKLKRKKKARKARRKGKRII